MEWYLDLNPNLELKVNVHEELGLELDLEILHEFFYKPVRAKFFSEQNFTFF